MNAVLPNKTINTTTPKNTFIEVNHTLQDGYLLYRPDDNSFIALYPEEFFLCRKDGEENNQTIHQLQEANQTVTEKSLALAELLRNPAPGKADLKTAQSELDQALATLNVKSEAAKTRIEKIVDLKADEKKLVELLPLTLARDGRQKAFYIPAQRLKSAMADKRVYLVEGKAERAKAPKDKLFANGKLNAAEVKRRIETQAVDKAKFSKKWKLKPKDGDEYAGLFFEQWSKTMGASAKDFLEREQKDILEGVFGPINADPNDPHRRIDLKSEAQLMRWAVGAGLEANFLPFQGNLYDKRDKDMKSRFKRAAKAAQFNVKANAEASFSLGEAKVQTVAYYPHYAGMHVIPSGAGIALDMGHFRFRGEMSLYAVAGASLALEAEAALMLTAGKQGLRGAPKDKAAAKAKANAGGKVELFAGLKEGVDLNGALQWLNPEGFIDDKAPQKKALNKSWGEYTDVASVGAGVAGIEGLAASLGFEVGYKNGNFVIAAKASGCLGLGGEGNFAGKVGAAQLGNMFSCVFHQLKQADYSKVKGLMQEPIFKAINHVMYMVVAGETTLRDFANSGLENADAIRNNFERAVTNARSKGANFIQELQRQLSQGWGWYAYLPPESRGAMIASINDLMLLPVNAGNQELRLAAAFSVNELIRTTQSEGHLDNTLDRITTEIGQVPGRNRGMTILASLVDDTSFAGCVGLAQTQLAKAEPLLQRPFLRNDEPAFIAAQFPLHHPSAQA